MPNFDGLRVFALESRRATELATLISTYGGRPLVVPALREVPLESNTEALAFAAGLMRGEFEMTVFLTGVGTRALVSAVESLYPRATFAAALARTRVVARGPKPIAALRELGVPVWVSAPEPNTWREMLAAIDAKGSELRGSRIAVQEYGITNNDLLDALRARGATVTRVPVYRWALPEDVGPLKDAVTALAGGELDVALFTTGVQVVHLWEIVTQLRREPEVRLGLSRMVIASIGPTTSEELQRHGLSADLLASHPKIGVLVREAAERSADLLRAKRRRGPTASSLLSN
jgi:uroporphyrinogen-III synthase